MHTMRVNDEAGEEWVITHNGDWSGDVVIRQPGNYVNVPTSSVIPGRVLLQISERACKDRLRKLLERLTDALCE